MPFKPKILVIGHSWVKYIQDEHMRSPVEDFEITFAFEEGIRIDGLIDMVAAVLTPQHTHVLLFSLLTDTLCVQPADARPGKNSRYQVLVPNQGFDPQYFAQRMNAFTECCKMINPNVKIVLMVPPVVDLVHHNKVRVEAYPPPVQRSYMENPQYDDHLLYSSMKEVSSTMLLLKGNNFFWLDKRIYPLQYVAQIIQPIRNRLVQFMKGEIFTLGKSGHLCDGFHPSANFIQKMWARIKNANVLELPKNPKRMQNNNASQQTKPKRMKYDKPPLLKNPSPSSMAKFNSSQKEPSPLMKIEFDSFSRESNQPQYNPSSTFAAKKLPLPPPPPQLSSMRIQNIQQRDNNGQMCSYPISSPVNSKMDSETGSSNIIPAPTKPRSLQLVDLNYMSQEIDKFASFMAGHAHAVGQNLSIRDVKQMMITVLQES